VRRVRALWVFVPVLGAPLLHAPVLTWDLLPGLRRPLDGGATWRGRRILGDNKTWRGALAMVIGIVAATALLSLWPWYWRHVPGGIRDAGPWAFGLLLGVGTVLGELPNSFLKRRLGIAPGARQDSRAGRLLSLYDQGDFVLVVWVLLLPLWVMTPVQALIVFAVVSALHLAINVVAYAIGARDTPL
jgi:CDP-2,3-bis-(O-geranylgeranyl)-sn-glycerol synthase